MHMETGGPDQPQKQREDAWRPSSGVFNLSLRELEAERPGNSDAMISFVERRVGPLGN